MISRGFCPATPLQDVLSPGEAPALGRSRTKLTSLCATDVINGLAPLLNVAKIYFPPGCSTQSSLPSTLPTPGVSPTVSLTPGRRMHSLTPPFLLQIEHDPRMPAYIATQGPLSHTIADFWQVSVTCLYQPVRVPLGAP